MCQFDLIALGIRETRSREAARQAPDVSTRRAHLKLAERYKDEIAAINRRAIATSKSSQLLLTRSYGLAFEQNDEEIML